MRNVLCLILLLITCRAFAQVGMTVQLPPVGVVMKAQLWNIVLVSGNSAPMNVRIALRINDVQTGQPVLTAMTRRLTISRGAKQLKVADVMPVEYEYFSAAIDRNVNGLLPTGNFIACYNLVLEDKGLPQPGEDCMPFAVEPMSPPLLSSPANKSTIDGNKPMFTWLPPAPASMFGDLNYEMILTEVHDRQSPEEAVQQNIPVYRVPRVREIFANYPSGAVALDTAKQYAWTVVAKNGNQFAAQTEVWTFRVKGPDVKKTVYDYGYVQLKQGTDGAVINSNGALQFSYNNDQNDVTVPFEVIALDNHNKVVQSGSLKLAPGENLLKVTTASQLDNGKQYLFRLTNTRKEHWQLKFIFTRPEENN